LREDFIAWLDGFSPNVQDILAKFHFRDQIQKLVDAHILGYLIEDFLNPAVNLASNPVRGNDGKIKLPALDNHGMGTVFEELIHRFNEKTTKKRANTLPRVMSSASWQNCCFFRRYTKSNPRPIHFMTAHAAPAAC